MKLKYLFGLFLLMLIPLVSAYSYPWDPYYNSPADLLQNEWILFALIFVGFFALIYFSLGQSMKQSKGSALIISLIVSLFISFAISQKARVYSYLGESIGNWLLIIALILGILLIVRLVTRVIGGIGLFLSLFAVWLVLNNIDPYTFFSNDILVSDFFGWWSFFSGFGFLLLIIAVFVILLIIAYAGEGSSKVRDWIWRGKGRYTEIKIPR